MSSHRQRRKHNATGEDGGLRSKANRQDSPRTGIERRATTADATALPNRLFEAGNTAVGQLLNRLEGGKPLESEIRNKMERAYGEDFGDVRVHDDAQSLAAAESISAEAFTTSDDIYLGRSAPPVESEAGSALIAHELAHVTQKRRAKGIETGKVSKPRDRFEQAAEMAAHKAIGGQRVVSRISGAPPALQRQPKEQGATRAEVQQAVTSFLETAKQAQGGRTLQITTEVRRALEMLATAGDDSGGMRLTNIQALLDNSMTPRDPAELAAKVAQLLPEPFDRTALQRLSKATAIKPVPSTKMGRVGDLVKRTAPGSAESEQERVSSDKTRRRNQREEIAPTQAPGVPSAEQRAEQVRGVERTVRGQKEPGITPKTFDLFRAIRILKDLPGALKGPRTQAPQPRAQVYPGVSRAIEKLVSRDALIPAEASGRAKRAERSVEVAGPGEEDKRRAERQDARAAVGTFEDAQEVAGRLAALMDIAHQQGGTEVDLPLVGAYNNVKDRGNVYSELVRIARLVRDQLPHHAAGVTRVNVYFGAKMVLRIPLDSHQ